MTPPEMALFKVNRLISMYLVDLLWALTFKVLTGQPTEQDRIGLKPGHVKLPSTA